MSLQKVLVGIGINIVGHRADGGNQFGRIGIVDVGLK